jgi:hypothetical protein
MTRDRRAGLLLAWPMALALLAYSLALILLELRTSQGSVRPYFEDIESAEPFFAVNTTLSSMLLFGAALLLFFTAAEARQAPLRQRLLMAIQGLFCLWTSLDDRFMFHEYLSGALAVGDGWIMAGVGVANALAYLVLFRPADISRGMAACLMGAALFFTVMLYFDTSVFPLAPLRLSMEDLAKSWSSFMFLLFAWQAASFILLRGSPAFEAFALPASLLRVAPPWWRESHTLDTRKDALDTRPLGTVSPEADTASEGRRELAARYQEASLLH